MEKGAIGSAGHQPERVIVAMSGGVDSSVAALLLHESGYEICGVTLRLFGNEDIGLSAESTCCSLDDIADARSVATYSLGVPHYVFNFGETFERGVIERFCKGYLCGETPNPCIDCNRFVKFDALQQRRIELGFDYVATGHYARRRFNDRTGRFELLRGKDCAKDQSYVLFHLTQEHLAHMLFPLGELTKRQVRERASAAGLVNARKHESQDICFVPDGDYASFIERHCGCALAQGDIVDEGGRLLGRHAGLARYTIGQRKGLGIAASEPLYVLRKDVGRNALVVGPRERLCATEVLADEANFIAVAPEEALQRPLRVTAKTAYRQDARPAWATYREDGVLLVHFDDPVPTPAAGQAVVLYDGDVVVGGATIRSAR